MFLIGCSSIDPRTAKCTYFGPSIHIAQPSRAEVSFGRLEMAKNTTEN